MTIFVLVCGLINGKYPNYETVIPEESPNVLDVSRDGFLNAVKRVSIFSDGQTNQVKFDLKSSGPIISAEDHELHNKADERLDSTYSGSDMQIGFNAAYLIQTLSHLDCKEVSLRMSTPNKAGLLVPIDGLKESEEILMLVMPVTVS